MRLLVGASAGAVVVGAVRVVETVGRVVVWMLGRVLAATEDVVVVLGLVVVVRGGDVVSLGGAVVVVVGMVVVVMGGAEVVVVGGTESVVVVLASVSVVELGMVVFNDVLDELVVVVVGQGQSIPTAERDRVNSAASSSAATDRPSHRRLCKSRL